MSGHSKWANIKRKKEVMDAKRGKIFTRLVQDIMVAARTGGDINANPTLRTIVEKAKGLNMPKERIDRAVAKGSGKLEGTQFVETVYEGYGAGGVAIIVKGLTDNRNRTASEVRYIFTKNGGALGEAGSVSYIFPGGDHDHPTFRVPLNADDQTKLDNLIDELSELNDVTDTFHNAELLEQDLSEEID